MKTHLKNLIAALLYFVLLPVPAFAASVALATAPLATSSTSLVIPNVFLMMDDSGSMGWAYLPDTTKSFSGSYGYASSQCNGVYYDPSLTYAPPVSSTGTSYPNSSFTAAWNDGYNTGSGTTNLSTSFIDIDSDSTNNSGFSAQAAFYYTYSGTQTTNAQKDYFNTASTFYQECNSAIGSTPGSGVFTKVIVGASEQTNFANWYSYYHTRINMMKTATGLAFKPIGTNYRVGFATMNNNGGTDFINAAPFDAANKLAWYNKLYATSAGSSTPLLGALADIGKVYANKLASKNGVAVVDPVQYSCQQNFTILTTDGYWNSQTGDTKLDGSTAVGNQDGTAGRPMYDGATVGSTWTNTYTRNVYTSTGSKISGGGGSNCSGSNKRLLVRQQTGSCTVATAGATCMPPSWSATANNYVAPYTSASSTCTATVTLPSPSTTSPALQSSVQSTSGGTSNTLADVSMYYYQTDLRTGTFGSTVTGTLNNCTGALGTDVCQNNVFISTLDNNTQQHMTTFTLGLGAKGRMVYSSSYLSDSTGDYVAVNLGSTASSTICPWQAAGTVCNWPIPSVSGTPENIDDLWHAAVDGRGAYFNATNPSSLSASLSNALAGINSRKGAAAAAATSTLNPVAGNNFAYVASYTTVAWKGNLEARGINVDTGVVSSNATWCVENTTADTCAAPGSVVADSSGSTTIYNCVTPNSVICTGGTQVGTDCYVPVATACTGTMFSKVSDLTDTRTIVTANAAGNALINFDAAYATANSTYFDAARISSLSQWSSLTPPQQTAAAGTNLVNFLRGQNGYEDRSSNLLDNRLYRYREAVLGDALESQPAFLGAPVFSYTYPGYSAFFTAQASRAGTVYMGANDGMMHAFAADTGIERWAYVPSMVIPNMWKLADKNYGTLHANFVNGSAVTTDVCTANCNNANYAATVTTADDPVWKTILVGGLNGGGRGYYALDITNPSAPALLWEFTPASDSDVGYSYGVPVVTRKTDGTWVVLVTSGYDNGTLSSNPSVSNSPAGSGVGYLYVLNAGTGAIVSKISTGVGTAATPSGLAKIAGWNNEPSGNLSGFVYGGDLLGNLWRFDINSTVVAAVGTGDVLKFATLFSDVAGTLPQPIMTTPVLGNIVGKRAVFIGTGKYLETADLSTTQTQTEYAILDDNAMTTLVNPRNSLVSQTLASTGATRTVTNNMVNFYTGRGWYVDFPDSGERVNIDAKLIQGTLVVPTIVPSNTVCSPGGYSWLNYFNYATGGAVNAQVGAPPALASSKYDATIVGINVVYIGGQPKVGVVTSNNPTPVLNESVVFSSNAANFSGKRVLWRELIP
ncbi:MAG: PilC/PilY family type IV pilus protein [Gallionella sp.]|nr:PilC/PilY family type IV pilus protein [Gallionella sp.]